MPQALVPADELVYPVFFGLCEGDGTAERQERTAVVRFGDAQRRAGREIGTPMAGHHYTINVCMTLPESAPNEAAGTFLVGLTMLGGGSSALSALAAATAQRHEPLLVATRPMVLRYKSPLLRTFWTTFYALPLLLGLMEEKQEHCVELSSSFFNSASAPAVSARLSLSQCDVQVYEAWLSFQLRFDRLSYLMHRWYFSSAVVGVGALMLLQLVALLTFAARPMLRAAGAAAALDADAPGGIPVFDRDVSDARMADLGVGRGGGLGVEVLGRDGLAAGPVQAPATAAPNLETERGFDDAPLGLGPAASDDSDAARDAAAGVGAELEPPPQLRQRRPQAEQPAAME